mgnify:CR=1 FL=1
MKGLVALVVVGLMVGALLGLAPAWAASRNPECVQDAQDEYKECIAVCRETMQVSKDLCRNVDHECAETCRQAYIDCIGPYIEALEACKDDCDAQREQDVQACRDEFGGNPAALDDCIDQAQVQAFMCRDRCREQTQIRARLTQCRQALRSCIQGCGPATR